LSKKLEQKAWVNICVSKKECGADMFNTFNNRERDDEQ